MFNSCKANLWKIISRNRNSFFHYLSHFYSECKKILKILFVVCQQNFCKASIDLFRLFLSILAMLTLEAPTPENGQTHSNNFKATKDVKELCKALQYSCRQLTTSYLTVFDHFVGLAFKCLIKIVSDVVNRRSSPTCSLSLLGRAKFPFN